MVKQQWACFMTNGFTEAGSMQQFLEKISDKWELHQCFPNKPLKNRKKRQIDYTRQGNGLTGNALLVYIEKILERQSDEYRRYDGILIEDDLDGHFYGWPTEAIHQHIESIKQKVREILDTDIPVIVLYASPEVEAWFYADWQQGFHRLPMLQSGNIIRPADAEIFSKYLKNYLDEFVLCEYSHDVEAYHVVIPDFIRLTKLSDAIRQALEIGVFQDVHFQGDSPEMVRQFQRLKQCNIRYSKRTHGSQMLRSIRPDKVQQECRHYFRSAYFEVLDILNG